MRLLSWHLTDFFRDSISQRIFRPGESDLHITLPEERLFITFCHKGDVHLGGTDVHLLDAALSPSPFSELGFVCR